MYGEGAGGSSIVKAYGDDVPPVRVCFLGLFVLPRGNFLAILVDLFSGQGHAFFGNRSVELR